MLKSLKTKDDDDSVDTDDDIILEAQEKEIKAKYGKGCARNANYGWGSSDGTISTKVYGTKDGVMILTSWIDHGEMVHEWSEYSKNNTNKP
jgi:hypothetical protein